MNSRITAETIVETVSVYATSDPGGIGTPSTCRSRRHSSSVGCVGQAALLASAVTYGPNSTVIVAVTNAEHAQSYQYHLRCSSRCCGVERVITGSPAVSVRSTGEL